MNDQMDKVNFDLEDGFAQLSGDLLIQLNTLVMLPIAFMIPIHLSLQKGAMTELQTEVSNVAQAAARQEVTLI